jgi:pimeloyl-ACP methyl ester carboxylesterase
VAGLPGFSPKQNAEQMRSSPVEFDSEEEAIRYNQERYPTAPGEAMRHRVRHSFQRLSNGKFGPKYDALRVAQGLTYITYDLKDCVREVTCPVGFMVGSRSTQLSRDQAERVAPCYEKTEVRIYEVDSGNVVQLENPEGLARSIREFAKIRSAS